MNNYKGLKYHTAQYQYTALTNYFTKCDVQTDLTPLARMPYELHFEPTQIDKIKVNASTLLTSKKVKEKYKFYTGVQNLALCPNWYVGNLVDKIKPEKITSIVIVHHGQTTGKLEIYYFRYFDKLNTVLRHEFAIEFVQWLIKKGDAIKDNPQFSNFS
jgi:hypothetical protein